MGTSKLLREKALTSHTSMAAVGEIRRATGPPGKFMVGSKQASAQSMGLRLALPQEGLGRRKQAIQMNSTHRNRKQDTI